MAAGWEPSSGEFPAPPRNVEVVSAFQVGILDLRWDSPAILSSNTNYTVLGVNIYRAYNERGPYQRLTPYPVGGTVWRDFTDNTLVSNEVVDWNQSWISRGETVAQRDLGIYHATTPTSPMAGHREGSWTFRTQYPIHKQFGQAIAADSPYDVSVTVNGELAEVHRVLGPEREVTLVNAPEFESVGEQYVGPVLPSSQSDEVLVSYHTNRSLVKTDLDAKPVYRVTTVAIDSNTHSGLTETPLEFVEPIYLRDVEKIDYVWREAIRRNNWILQQGGERVLLFIRKVTGQPCTCHQDPQRKEFYKQPNSLCLYCYGTGFVGGFDGPFEIIIAPDDAERRVTQGVLGRHLQHMYEVWTGPSPRVTHRDFIVKQTNERYAIGAIRSPASRGLALQQHFNISYIDEGNILYRVPVDGTVSLTWPQTRGAVPSLQGGAWPQATHPPGPYPVGPNQVHPMQTEKTNIPDDREQRGRTRIWETITY